MRPVTLVVGVAVTTFLAGVGSMSLSAQSKGVPAAPAPAARPAATADTFVTLKAVKAAPMSAAELNAVKGLHVHFVTPSKNTQYGLEGLHLAGDVKTENNWSNAWGGTDGVAVAPSYKGLCVAHAQGGIFIPTMGPITTQCP